MSNASEKPASAQWPELEDPEQLERIIDIIAEDGAIDRELITPEATLETLGLESMDVVMILMGAEEKLNIYLPMDNDLSSARNMAEFVAAIDRALKAGKPAEAG
ncbi:acyl carrier protein [Hoeflea sp.]|uniref:acyl carrier protein n=1 Tax=Hoeflea sp. TaxID=1940281 RepID=UPI003B518F9C